MKTRKEPSGTILRELQNVRKYFENLPHRVFVKDKDLIYLFCNNNYAADLGIRPDAIKGKDDYEFYPRELADKYRTDDQRVLASGKSEDLEERYVVEGQTKFVNTHKIPLKNEKGETIAIMGFFSDITDYKAAEEKAIRQNKSLAAINAVFKEAINCDSEASLARACLTIAEELTGSRFGFIGEVNQSGRFDTIALSNPGWENCNLPESESALLIQDMEIRGLWGKVIRDNTALIANDPAAHPDRVGVPDGHPPLTAFLGVPLQRAGSVVGMMALGNKTGGYDEGDQACAEALAGAIVEALKNKRAEQQVARMAQEILEVSTPVIQIWDGVVLAPLIGMLDSRRTQRFMDRFLERIVDTQSSTALLDITGVPTIDTQTGQHLIEAITAAKLLGTQVILTGVSPNIAQTLVHLGIDMAGFLTCASLAAGFKMALDIQQLAVVSKQV